MTDRHLIPRREVAKRDGISVRTQIRREKDPKLAFPNAVVVNRRVYFFDNEHRAWQSARERRT